MALLILALLQRIFLMSSLMLLLVWLIFFMVLIKLLPRSEERFSRNAETELVCRLLLEKKKVPPVTSMSPCTDYAVTETPAPSTLMSVSVPLRHLPIYDCTVIS